MYNLSILSERSEKSHKYETLNHAHSKYNSASPPLSRATSPLNHDREGGLKVRINLFSSFLYHPLTRWMGRLLNVNFSFTGVAFSETS